MANQEEKQSTTLYQYKIKNNPFGSSKVEIIIPFHNQQNRISSLVSSILNAVKSNPYRITLVDDKSDNAGFSEKIKDIDSNRPKNTMSIINVINNKEQIGFGASVNKAIKETNFPWVLVMHADCLVEDKNFLLELGNTMLKLKNENIKFVCPKTNYYQNITTEKLIGKKFEKTNDLVLENEFCPMFCFLTHRELYNKIGPIKEYKYAGFEDEEFYHRMKKNGYKQAICGKSWVGHIGSTTIKELLKKYPDIMQENRKKCEEDILNIYK